jgi:hypothetical protein
LNLPVALTGPRVWLALHPVIMGGPSVDRCDSERSPVLVAVLLPSWSRPITCTPSARCRPTIGFIRGRWRHIKGDFSRRVAAVDTIPKNRGDEYRLWRHGCSEHTIRNDTDLARHIDYVRFNPPKHGLLEQVRDWRFSSFHPSGFRRMLWPDEGKP